MTVLPLFYCEMIMMTNAILNLINIVIVVLLFVVIRFVIDDQFILKWRILRRLFIEVGLIFDSTYMVMFNCCNDIIILY